MASRNGSATVAPSPRRTVRRGNDFRVMSVFSLSQILAHLTALQGTLGCLTVFGNDCGHWNGRRNRLPHLAGSIVWRSRWGRRFRLPVEADFHAHPNSENGYSPVTVRR